MTAADSSSLAPTASTRIPAGRCGPTARSAFESIVTDARGIDTVVRLRTIGTIRVGFPGRFGTCAHPGQIASAAAAAASSSSIRCAVSGTVSRVNVKVGVNRTPVPAPTLVRSTRVARSSAAAAPA
ncbi:hypothetical protein C1Y40_05335 [Mycobacterium talmoniae]|uniref:Uncharacterized protein n=1 Tax=Mycobacterium talmoniae TaxID=1858794 RepID=A0A2S8BCY1_9MYCO|nr:hypothetical protein C1Y40_05335 [Mycobacterium talmoniae]